MLSLRLERQRQCRKSRTSLFGPGKRLPGLVVVEIVAQQILVDSTTGLESVPGPHMQFMAAIELFGVSWILGGERDKNERQTKRDRGGDLPACEEKGYKEGGEGYHFGFGRWSRRIVALGLQEAV